MKSSAIGNTAMSNGFTSYGRVNVEIGTEPRSWALYNEILTRRPDLLEALYEPMGWDRQGDVPEGEQPWDRMELAGYTWRAAGENIAAGNSTAAATMDQWMNSSGHCRNIMNGDFSDLGVGHVEAGAI